MRNFLVISILLLTSACSQRLADLTIASTKNININGNSFVTGKRVKGTDTKAILLFPLGHPSFKEAIDRAMEQDKCAVALSDAVMDWEYFSFLVGYITYKAEGNLVIDASKPGCGNKTNKETGTKTLQDNSFVNFPK